MGLIEARKGTKPTEGMQELVRTEVKNKFISLFSNGGIITHSGVILPIPFEEIEDAFITDEQLDTLKMIRTLSLKGREVEKMFPENSTIKHVTSHIVLPDTLGHLGYRETQNGSMRLVIRGTNTKQEPHDHNIGSDWQLGYALSRYAAITSKNHGFYNQIPSIRRYSDGILKEIASQNGVGKIPNKIQHKLSEAR